MSFDVPLFFTHIWSNLKKPHTNIMNKNPTTEIITIDDTTLEIKVYTEENTTSKIITFTSKLSLTKYIDRLRKNLYKTDIPLSIVDTIRNITLKFNITEQSEEVTQDLNHQVKKSDKLRFIPKTMVKVEKSSKDIKKERIKEILRDIQFGDMKEAQHKLDKYFDK